MKLAERRAPVQVGDQVEGYLVEAKLGASVTGTSRLLVLRCVGCGARIERQAQWLHQEALPCRHPAIDACTPWEEDDRCWYVVAHHPDGLTLKQVGELLGVTRERVRQIEVAALRRLVRECARVGVSREAFRHVFGATMPEEYAW